MGLSGKINLRVVRNGSDDQPVLREQVSVPVLPVRNENFFACSISLPKAVQSDLLRRVVEGDADALGADYGGCVVVHEVHPRHKDPHTRAAAVIVKRIILPRCRAPRSCHDDAISPHQRLPIERRSIKELFSIELEARTREPSKNTIEISKNVKGLDRSRPNAGLGLERSKKRPVC